METVDILGVNVSCAKAQSVLKLAEIWSRQDVLRTIYYVNTHCMNIAYEDRQYREVLNRADLVYADGIGVVWASQVLGGCRLQKTTASDWLDDFCAMASANGLRFYILAGRPGVAEKAGEELIRQWPDLLIVGAGDGFFERRGEVEVLLDLQKTSPHILFVGMGTPLQEKWVDKHRQDISAPICWGIGSLFDLVAGVEPWAPGWMCDLSLQWLWRLLVDPRNKWRRYLIGNPQFLYRIIYQSLSTRRDPGKKRS